MCLLPNRREQLQLWGWQRQRRAIPALSLTRQQMFARTRASNAEHSNRHVCGSRSSDCGGDGLSAAAVVLSSVAAERRVDDPHSCRGMFRSVLHSL